MGVPELLGTTWVEVAGRRLEARHVDMGNPHAVALADGLDLDALGPLLPPGYDHALYPEGVNVELVQRTEERRVRMRVHERGSGETRSCGTGVCAAAVAEAASAGATRPVTYRVDVPGGGLQVTWRTDDHVVLTGRQRSSRAGRCPGPAEPVTVAPSGGRKWDESPERPWDHRGTAGTVLGAATLRRDV
jgi:diaminopimelate epimerase